MTVQTLKIGKEKLVVLREKDYRSLIRKLDSEDEQDAADVAEARRRMRTEGRKTIPWAQVKRKAGL